MFKRLMRRQAAGEGGFTLIELLVVIVILGILSAVVVFAVSGINDKGQDSACKMDTRTLATAEEAFLASPTGGNGQYGTEAQLVSGGFLSEASSYHDIPAVTAGGNPTPLPSYEILVADSDCGTVGAAVDGTSNF